MVKSIVLAEDLGSFPRTQIGSKPPLIPVPDDQHPLPVFKGTRHACGIHSCMQTPIHIKIKAKLREPHNQDQHIKEIKKKNYRINKRKNVFIISVTNITNQEAVLR